MHFIVFAIDKPGHVDLRQASRPDHLEYLTSQKDIIVTAGPMQSDDGASMIGSMLVIDVPDRAAAEAFAKNDPYAKAGLFESTVIKRWKRTIPAE
ncbi:YciI family protein [Thalassospiraceae bacterium LMO-SO8]|nr:YciI family protein [Alphaproteobacteria bacterium LMO-S08]WND77726.1 YciI family protein [Thalassospiraceae bacterium LMO-SO8]